MCTLGALALRRRGWYCGEILGVLQYHRLSQILVRLGPRVLSAIRGGSPRGLDPGWVSVHPGSLVATCTLAPRLDLGPSPTSASLPWGGPWRWWGLLRETLPLPLRHLPRWCGGHPLHGGRHPHASSAGVRHPLMYVHTATQRRPQGGALGLRLLSSSG